MLRLSIPDRDLTSETLTLWQEEWSNNNNLSFIQNDGDKKIWITKCENTLLNPLSSRELKIRCCLLIHKLSPAPEVQEIIDSITENLASDLKDCHKLSQLERISLADHLDVFHFEFSKNSFNDIVAKLRGQLSFRDAYETRSAAIPAIGIIAPYAEWDDCSNMFQHLIIHACVSSTDSRAAKCAIDILPTLAPNVSEAQYILSLRWLDDRLENRKSDTDRRLRVFAVLDAIKPFVPKPLQGEMDELMASRESPRSVFDSFKNIFTAYQAPNEQTETIIPPPLPRERCEISGKYKGLTEQLIDRTRAKVRKGNNMLY